MFYSVVLRARVALGRWPTPNNPDPKALGYVFHAAVIDLSFLVAVTSPIYLGLAVYVIGFLASFWLPEPKHEEMPSH